MKKLLSIFLIFAFLVIPIDVTHAAVAHSSTLSNSGTTNSLVISNVVNTGTDRVIVVSIAYKDNGGGEVTGVAFNAAGGDRAFAQLNSESKNGEANAQLWYLAGSDDETADVTISTTNAVRIVAISNVYTGVDQTNPFRTSSIANGTNGTLTVNFTALNGEIVVDAGAQVSAGPDTISSQSGTPRGSNTVTGGGTDTIGMAQEIASSGATETMSYTMSSTDNWAIIAGGLQPPVITATYDQEHYWFLDDDQTTINNATGYGAGDTAADTSITGVPLNTDLRARFAILQDTASPAVNLDLTPKLQFKVGGTTGSCTADSWTDVPTQAACSGEALCQATSGNFTDGDATTQRFSDGDAFVAADGINTDGTPNQSTYSSNAEHSEWEWMLNLTSNAAYSSTYTIRTAYSSGTALETYTLCPTLVTESAPAASILTMGTHRWFQNLDSLTPGRPASINQAIVAPPQGTGFRLRFNLHASGNVIAQSGTTTKLQFGTKSGATCDATGDETYSDVTTSSAISYYDNTGVTDDTAITTYGFDPKHASTTTGGSDVLNLQNYNDGTSNTTLINSQSAIPVGEDGLWDISLKDNTAPSGTTYCFRVVQNGGEVLGSYGSSTLPEIRTQRGVSVRLTGTVRLRTVRLR